MSTPADVRQRVAAAYDAAADTYDHLANSFWERHGARTIARLELQPGMRVLDACCGSGASALPAAERVGPRGAVLGIDLAASLLELARGKARARGLRQAEFRAADLLALEPELGTFDAVVCVFGIFFVPDMEAAVAALWGRVRPGGCLAVTTWGPRVFEPLNSAFWQAVGECRPELQRSFNPWDKITEPDAVRALLERGGVDPRGIELVARSSGTARSSWSRARSSAWRRTSSTPSRVGRAERADRPADFFRRRARRRAELSTWRRSASGLPRRQGRRPRGARKRVGSAFRAWHEPCFS